MVCMSWPLYRPCWIIQKSEKCLFEWSKYPKTMFLAIFLTSVHRIDLILHIMIELNGQYHLAIVSVIMEHSKIRKMPFWMIQIAKNEVSGRFLDFGASDWLDIAYYDRTKWSARFGHSICPFLNLKNAFLNDPDNQKRCFWPFSRLWCIGLTWYCILW